MEIFLPRCRYQTRGDALLHCITFPLSIDGLCFLRYHRFGFVFEITAFLRRRRLLVWLLHFDPSSPLVAALKGILPSFGGENTLLHQHLLARIAEDLKDALSLWPNGVPTIMFYNIIDLLQMKGSMEDVYSFINMSFNQ
ncbi:hypothetical protein P8452_38271 [Trifolium repens]|nr:hypothetical protein P8452_38271 [Trifolium repens]